MSTATTAACAASSPRRRPQAGRTNFFYRATWMRVLSGAYRAGHQVRAERDGHWTFSGEHQMPRWAGGLYRYQGVIADDQFQAEYRCQMDHGTYRLSRVPPEK